MSMSKQESDDLIKDIVQVMEQRGKTSITWEEFVIVNEMWHDDGIIIPELFVKPLEEAVVMKWHRFDGRSVERLVYEMSHP